MARENKPAGNGRQYTIPKVPLYPLPEQEELLQLRDAVIYDALYGRQYITAAMNEPAEKAA